MSRSTTPSPLHALRVAVGFLTRIPVGDVSRRGTVDVDMARAVPWFTTVGLAIGAFQGAVYFGASQVLSPLVAAVLSLGASLLLTGAFHHDGLADIADAFGGGWTVEERMVILKDSRLGTYGVSALAIALLLEVTALSQLAPAHGFRALVVAHALGRGTALVAMLLAPAAGDGMGADYTKRLSTPAVLLGVVVAVGASVVGLPETWPLALAGAGLAGGCVVALAIRKIGGINGDVLGAVTVTSGLLAVVTAGI